MAAAATDLPRSKLTVVIPCFNERATILEIVGRVKELPIDASIIVIDNCSTDGTRELLRSVCSNERALRNARLSALQIEGQTIADGDGFHLVLQPRNLKKGMSVRTGLALSNSDYVVCQDADLEYDPNDIVRLLDFSELSGTVAVFGSRLANRPRLERNAFHVGRVALTMLFTSLYGTRITDVATCYKLMRTDVAQSLALSSCGFDLDFEIPVRLRQLGYSIEELPVQYHPRTLEQGKKIRWRDGLSAAWLLVRSRLF